MCSNRICRLSRSRISAACLLMVSLSFKFQRALGLLIHFFSLFFGPSAGTTMYLFMTSWGPPFKCLNFDLSSCIYVFSCSPEVRCSVGQHQRGFLTAPLWCINPENNLIELSYIAAPAPQVNFQWNLDSLSNLASISFHSLEQPQNATPPCSLPP